MFCLSLYVCMYVKFFRHLWTYDLPEFQSSVRSACVLREVICL